MLILFLFITARPQYGNKQKKINDSGRDLVVVVDTSGSMKALDFKIEGENTDRLSVVKQVLKRFVQKGKGIEFLLSLWGLSSDTISTYS